MRNIISYLRVIGKNRFEEKEFNPVDSLLLCQLSYNELEYFIPTIEEDLPGLKVGALNDINIIRRITKNTINVKCNRLMLPLIATCPRFSEMEINWMKVIFDPHTTEQFGAVTFLFPEFVYIALRGTDLSLLGWKEDFYLALKEEIPAQQDALKYLQDVANKTELPIYIGGHSKGGNLALYAAYRAEDKIKDRIIQIFNHDGPGYKNNFFGEIEFEKIRNKIHKTVPRDTTIGVLLNHLEADEIVQSRNIGLFQHDPYNWLLNKNYEFKTVTKASLQSAILDRTIMEFVNSYTEEEALRIVNILFEIAGHSNVTSVGTILARPFRYLMGVGRHYNKMTKEEKRIISEARSRLMKLWGKNIKSTLLGGKKVTMEININDTILETERLILRQWKETDVEDFFAYASVPGVGDMAGWEHHKTIEESMIILKSFIAENNTFAIVYRDNQKVIGSIGLKTMPLTDDCSSLERKNKYMEIGYALAKEYWGRGLMPEGVEAVIQYCFKTLKLDMVTCGHFTSNTQSKRVIEKLGFTYLRDRTSVYGGKNYSGVLYYRLRK